MGCASAPPIEPEYVIAPRTVSAGAEATLSWSFRFADSVTISGIAGALPPKGQLKLQPQQTTTYTITAYRTRDRAQLHRSVTIAVVPAGSATAEGAETALPSRPPVEYSPMVVRVAYPPNAALPHQLWVTSPELWRVAALPSQPPQWHIEARCGERQYRLAPESVREYTDTSGYELLVCLDRSELTRGEPQALRRFLLAVLQELWSADRLILLQFREVPLRLHLLTSTDADPAVVDTLGLLPAEGLSAAFCTLLQALQHWQRSPASRQRLLLLITGNADNCSLMCELEEVADLARGLGIPVSVVHLGLASERASWRHLAAYTGGLFGEFTQPDWDSVAAWTARLLRGLHRHYRISLRMPEGCTAATLQLRAAAQTAEYRLQDVPPRFTPEFLPVCLFERGDTSIAAAYEPVLERLAALLRLNPKRVVELVGHSSLEGDPRLNWELGLRRAHAVRQRLLRLGVPARQLRLRSEGSSRPLHFLQQQPWQATLNRRVELRWLEPGGYELLLTHVATESAALEAVRQWEERGYRAYYELIVLNGQPAYRLKLWGFRTTAEALAARRQLQLRYGVHTQLW
jgi:outer membrane protein OmpA-like peptidoglycan-associated protein